MSKRDWKILFEDINEAINKIEQYTADFVFDDFVISTMVVDAVVRNLEIIGEASKNIPSEIRIKFPSIPWQKVTGIRNRIVHEYFDIDSNIIWFIIKNELPDLKNLISQCLNESQS